MKDRGVDVYGVDLSSGQIECAPRLNPDIKYERGDVLALDAADGSLAGVASFYETPRLCPSRRPHPSSVARQNFSPPGMNNQI